MILITWGSDLPPLGDLTGCEVEARIEDQDGRRLGCVDVVWSDLSTGEGVATWPAPLPGAVRVRVRAQAGSPRGRWDVAEFGILEVTHGA